MLTEGCNIRTPRDHTFRMQEVCRCLEVDLTGQTSASYNMRLNYEKCLLEFEMYLASGQYEIDLSVGNAPSADEVTHTNTKREVMNVYMPPPVLSFSAPSSAGPAVGTMTLRAREPRSALMRNCMSWQGA